MFSDDGAIVNERAFDPAVLLMSLGVCGPYPLQRLAAFAWELSPRPINIIPAINV